MECRRRRTNTVSTVKSVKTLTIFSHFISLFCCSQFDIREPHVCKQDDKVRLIDLQNHIGPNAEAKCLAINQRRSEQLAVGASDAYARVYDRRLIKLAKVCYFQNLLVLHRVKLISFSFVVDTLK